MSRTGGTEKFAKRSKGRPLAYRSRGYAYGNKGEDDRAIADYDKAIQLKTDDASITAP